MKRSFFEPCLLRTPRFLQVGTAALFGLSLADLLSIRSVRRRCDGRSKTRSQLHFHLAAGRAATIDMWDMKPDAPAGIRGEFHPIATSVPGLSICEHLPEMAKVMDRCVLVRSVSHTLGRSWAGHRVGGDRPCADSGVGLSLDRITGQ